MVVTVSSPPPPPGQLSVLKSGANQKKMCAWGEGGGDLKNSCHGYLPGGEGGLLCFLSKKDLNKIWL